jgi:thioredoxin-like negative regulator of GroEL
MAPSPDEAREVEALLASRRFQEAAARARHWSAAMPRDHRPHVALMRTHLATGRFREADEAAARGLRLAPLDPQLNLLKGIVDHRLGRSDAAIDRLRSLLGRRTAEEVEVGVALAEALHRAGRHEEIEATLAAHPRFAGDERSAIFAARLLARRDRAAGIESLRTLARTARSPIVVRIAGFEAVRLLDADGRYREAFELAREVHAATTPPFDLGAIEETFAAQRRLFARPARPALRAQIPPVERTSLVVALGRSGTTLLEQMLDRHPEISGIGEFEGTLDLHVGTVSLGLGPATLDALRPADASRLSAAYLAGAAARRRPGAAWTFDKALHTWWVLPELAVTLPGARLVRIRRDPRDVAISMFLSNFHPETLGFTRDLAAIRRTIELEREIVPNAIGALGLAAIDLAYEDLVAEPEREIRRVLDHLGVAFHPDTLAPEGNRRTVLTLSHEQVRRSINRTSIGRWRNYGFAFDGAWDTLDGK